MILTCKEVYSGLCINTLKQTIDELIVSTYRNTLIRIVEVVVVEDQTYGFFLTDLMDGRIYES